MCSSEGLRSYGDTFEVWLSLLRIYARNLHAQGNHTAAEQVELACVSLRQTRDRFRAAATFIEHPGSTVN